MSPTDRIVQGLLNVHEGLAELREDYERVTREQENRRSTMVDAEARLRALSTHAMAARRPRHLQPSEMHGPRRLPADTRGSIVSVSPVDEKTKRSLDLMGLTPRPKPEKPLPVVLSR